MASFPAPSALGAGEFALIENFRCADRSLYVRDGYSAFNGGSVVGSGGTTFRGCGVAQILSLSNNPLIVVGVQHSTKVKCYATNTGSFGAAFTASSGKYGDTEFTNSATDLLFISPLKGGTSSDSNTSVCIQSGTDSPRVYNPIDGTCAIHTTITPPSSDSALKTAPTWPKNFEVSGASMPTYTNSTAAQFAGASNGTTPNNNVRLTTGTGANAVNNGDTVRLTAFATATRDLSACRQLIFICETDDIDFWNNIKIEIAESGPTYVTVFDGSSASYAAPVYVPLDGVSNRYAIGFSLDHIATASRDAVLEIRFTWAGTTRASGVAAATVDIYAICGSGTAPGGALHGISYWNSASRAESPGLVIPTVEPSKINAVGGTTLSDAPDSRIPNSPLLYYNYTVYYQNTSSAGEVDYLRIYRKDYGEVIYSYVGNDQISSYSGSWSYVSGTALSTRSVTDSLQSYLKDTGLEMPDGYSLPIPKGGATLYANGRTFVAGYRASSSDIRDTLWISDDRHAFRFRKVVRFRDGVPDPSSGTSILFPGESIQQLVSCSTGIFGVDRVYVFTDKSLYAVDGRTSQNLSRASKIADVGTLSPHSVAQYKGQIYFLDSDMRVRRIAGGRFDDLSRFLVDDVLQGIPAAYRKLATGVYWKDRYYLAYTPTGETTNTKVLIWDETLNGGGGGWMQDAVSVGFQQGCIWSQSQVRKFLFCDATAGVKMYTYEVSGQTTDAGSAIPVKLTTGETHDDGWNSHMVRKIKILADDQANTLTWVRTYKPHGGTGTSTTNLDVSTNQSWLYDTEITASGTPKGSSSQIAMTGNMTGGTRIYSIVAEVEGLSSGAGRST